MENSNTASLRCLSIEGEGGAPKPIREIAWKAQLQLCARYRKLARPVFAWSRSWPPAASSSATALSA